MRMAVEPQHVPAELDHVPPPEAADVPLHLHAQRAVVPRRPQTAVDLAGLVDEAPSLAQRDERLHVDHATTLAHA
jgi:hypothetical protein